MQLIVFTMCLSLLAVCPYVCAFAMEEEEVVVVFGDAMVGGHGTENSRMRTAE